MTNYTNIFGGNTVQPSEVSFSTLVIANDAFLSWPSQGASPFTSAIVEVNPVLADLAIWMPTANNASTGETVTFNNIGGYSVTVKDYGGTEIVTIDAGQAFTVYLRDNTTSAGGWRYWQAGAGSSVVDAAAIDGAGLEAASGLLRVSMETNYFSSSQAFANANRGSLAVWNGGSGVFTVPLAQDVGKGWFMYFRNSGSGTLQITSTNNETFDGETDITLDAGQSITVACDGENFTTILSGSLGSVGGGSFSFTQVSVAGTGSFTLSAADAAYTAIRFTGVLTGNRTVVVPNTIKDYWITNGTTGSYTLTIKTSLGSGIAVTQTKSATLFCDGTDILVSDNDFPAGLSTPIAIASGGTAATTAGAALTNLGGTTVGTQVFTAASAAAARSAIGAAGTGVANTFTGNQAITGDLTVSGTISGATSALPSGTKMLFQQTAAPTGWVKDTTHNNKALRVVTGTAGFGGSVDFSTAFASQSVSGSTSSVAGGGTVGDTALTIAQMPAHSHAVTWQYQSPEGGSGDVASYLSGSGSTSTTSSVGGGAAHSHTFTGTAHAHTFSGSVNLAVQYVDLIIATKS